MRRRGVHPAVLRERAVDPVADRRAGRARGGLGARRSSAEILVRAPRRPGRDPRLRARRQAPHPRARRAQRAARARPGEAQGRAPPPAARRLARRPAEGARARRAAGADRVLRHLAPRRHAHDRRRWSSSRAARAKKSDYRRFNIREVEPGDDYGADGGGPEPPLRAVGEAERALPVRRRPRRVVRRAAQPRRDRRRQGPARGRPGAAAGLPRARRDGRLAGQADRGGVPAGRGRADRARRTTRPSCSCSSACATRRTGSRSPTTGSAATRR